MMLCAVVEMHKDAVYYLQLQRVTCLGYINTARCPTEHFIEIMKQGPTNPRSMKRRLMLDSQDGCSVKAVP